MMFDRMRLYDAGRFHDTELPDWYREAQRLSQAERIDWHCALERVLDCEYTLLTEDCTASAGLEIRFWPSEMNGILVLIEDPLGLVEQVVAPSRAKVGRSAKARAEATAVELGESFTQLHAAMLRQSVARLDLR